MGAFNQGGSPLPQGSEPPGHPLGPGFASDGDHAGNGAQASSAHDHDRGGVDPDPAPHGREDADFIAKSIRAASDLVDDHIRKGQDAARDLGRIPLGATGSGGDLTGLLSRLAQSYSEAGSAWVELVSSLARKTGEKESTEGTRTAPQPILRITTTRPVEASVDMFRAAINLQPQPLRTSGTEPLELTAPVASLIGDGRRACLTLDIGAGDAPGTYHGLILDAQDHRPAGTLTVTILPGPDPE